MSEPHYCRTCKRALNPVSKDGRLVAWLHVEETHGQKADHVADPVLLSQLPDAIVKCDFDSSIPATWVYRCADRVTIDSHVTERHVSHQDYSKANYAAPVRRTETQRTGTTSWGEDWAACDGCAQFIDADDMMGLMNRVVDNLPRKLTSTPKRLQAVRGQLYGSYTNFFETRLPGRGKITPEHPEGTWEE